MGAWLTTPATPSPPMTPKRELDDSTMHTPDRRVAAPGGFDPRSPTSEYNRTPILLNKTQASSNDENSPATPLPCSSQNAINSAVRPRTMHQQLLARKLNGISPNDSS